MGSSTGGVGMALAGSGLRTKNVNTPDETRPFERGKVQLVDLGAGAVGLATFEAGWRWSEHVKPIAGTDSCQASHVGYVISGRMRIVMDDGSQTDIGPGDVMVCPAGHDAWTIGDEACVVVDWAGMADYAKS